MLAESANISLQSKEALYLLAAPSTPEAVRQDAIERAEAGEPISYSTARDMVQDYKQRGFMVAFRVAV